MADESISSEKFFDELVALLFYRGEGSVSDFFRLLEMTCLSQAIKLDPQERSNVGGNILSKLYSVGVLLRFERRGQERWSVGGNRILLIDGFLIGIGDSSFQIRFKSLVKKQESEVHQIAPLYGATLRELSLMKFQAKPGQAQRIASRLDATVVDFEPLTLIEYLPEISEIFRQITEDAESVSFARPDRDTFFSHYDFSKHLWRDTPSISGEGLYKVNYRFGSTRTFVFGEDGSRIEVLRKDWGMLLARVVLNKGIQLMVSNRTGVVSLLGSDLSSIPDLLRNFLMGASLKWPEYKDDKYYFTGISLNSLIALSTKYPVLEICHER